MHSLYSRYICALIVTGLTVLSACSTTQKTYSPPKIDLPTTTASKAQHIDREWWKAFGDPLLNQLVADALINNFDLAKAAANVQEARANAGTAQSLLSPRLDGVGKANASKRRASFVSTDNDLSKTSSYLAGGLAVNWEIDLWGRIRSLNDAALAQLAASEHTQNANKLAVASAVVDTYMQLIGLDQQLAITQDAVKNLKAASNLEFRRWKAEAGTEMNYRQSLAELAATEARVPSIKEAIAKTELALKVLVGFSPRQMGEALPRGKSPQVPVVQKEIDFTLLMRRPDIASAEQLLLATNADINALRAEAYPRLTISLLAGIIAASSAAISGAPVFFDTTAGLAAPIFDAGQVQSKVDGAEARREKAVAHYRYTTSVAFRETYEAMVQLETSDQQVAATEKEVALRQRTLALMEKSYDAGRSSKYEVLSETIKVLNTQLTLANARQLQLIARSQYFKALGGGF